ncbi:hypothetical protein [Dickeya oryzae]|uniref:hypothetical protein n=1 Tax=Dickeya oryzae TaxID=1240404 RepID=UPI001297B77F|nr:hypothetical protein [Dickeya oryzae]
MNWWQELSPEPDNNTRQRPRKRTSKKPTKRKIGKLRLKIKEITNIHFYLFLFLTKNRALRHITPIYHACRSYRPFLLTFATVRPANTPTGYAYAHHPFTC